MLRLLGQMERFDVHGNKRMLPYVTFRVHRLTQYVAVHRFAYVWLGTADPTPEEWKGMADKVVRTKLEKIYGKALANQLVESFRHPDATKVG